MKLTASGSKFPVSVGKTPAGATPTAAGSEAQPLFGIFIKIASTFCFFLMITCLKWVSDDVPITQSIFSRNLFAVAPILIMMWLAGTLSQGWKTNRPFTHVTRAVVGVSGMACNFAALILLPLPDATAISFSGPLMVVVLAAFLLNETVRIYRWSAVFIGFCGVFLTVLPNLGQGAEIAEIGVTFAFMAAFFGAFAQITVRKLCQTERTATIVLWFTLASTFFAALTYPFGLIYPEWTWVMPNWQDGLYLVGVGVFGGIGQILLTQSYRYADASTVAPFDYMNMVWAILFGYALFSETPTVEVVVGSIIVISAGIFVIWREHQLGYDRTRQGRASTPSKS